MNSYTYKVISWNYLWIFPIPGERLVVPIHFLFCILWTVSQPSRFKSFLSSCITLISTFQILCLIFNPLPSWLLSTAASGLQTKQLPWLQSFKLSIKTASLHLFTNITALLRQILLLGAFCQGLNGLNTEFVCWNYKVIPLFRYKKN